MTSRFYQLLKAQVDKQLPDDLLSVLPRTYKRVGHVALILVHPSLQKYKYILGEAILQIIEKSGFKTIAEITHGIDGKLRTPHIQILAGTYTTETIHKELNCLFYLDAAELMFSAGNHGERKRLIEWVQKYRIEHPEKYPIQILDMFACVGNLSLPIATNLKNVKILALELNKSAVRHLEKSVSLNKLGTSTYEVIEGDNILTAPKNWAHIKLMGYFEITREQKQVAIRAIQQPEGWIFIHESKARNIDSSILSLVISVLSQREFQQWNLAKINSIKIKSITGILEHWVHECCFKITEHKIDI